MKTVCYAGARLLVPVRAGLSLRTGCWVRFNKLKFEINKKIEKEVNNPNEMWQNMGFFTAYLLACSYLICCCRNIEFFNNSCTLFNVGDDRSILWTTLQETKRSKFRHFYYKNDSSLRNKFLKSTVTRQVWKTWIFAHLTRYGATSTLP